MERTNRGQDTPNDNISKENIDYNRMLLTINQSYISLISKDLTSSPHNEILQKEIYGSKEHTEKKGQIEDAEKLLSEFESEFSKKQVKLEKKLNESEKIEKSIKKIEQEINELSEKLDQNIKKGKSLEDKLKENDEDFKGKQKNLQDKNQEFAKVEAKLKEIDLKIAKQKKKHQDLESYRKIVLAIKDSRPIDDIISRGVVTSTDAVFNPTQSSLKEHSELRRLGQIYKERTELAKNVSRHVESCQELREIFQERGELVSSQTLGEKNTGPLAQSRIEAPSLSDNQHSQATSSRTAETNPYSETESSNEGQRGETTVPRNTSWREWMQEWIPGPVRATYKYLKSFSGYSDIDRGEAVIDTEHLNIIEMSSNDHVTQLDTQDVDAILNQRISAIINKFKLKDLEGLPNIENDRRFNMLIYSKREVMNSKNDNGKALEEYELEEKRLAIYADLICHCRGKVEEKLSDLESFVKEIKEKLPELESFERNITNGENSIDVISEAIKLSEEGSKLLGKDCELLNVFERMQGQPFENFQPFLEKMITDNKARIELLSSSQQLLSNAPLHQKLLKDLKEANSIYNEFLSMTSIIKFTNSFMQISIRFPIMLPIMLILKNYAQEQLQDTTAQFRSYRSQVEQYKSQVEQYESQLKALNQLSQRIAALRTYQNYLAKAFNEHKASKEKFKQLDEFIFNKLKETIGPEKNLSKIDKDLEIF